MISHIRLSRIGHPRATLWAMALLALVFLALGLWAEAYLPGMGAVDTQINDFETLGSITWVKQLFVAYNPF